MLALLPLLVVSVYSQEGATCAVVCFVHETRTNVLRWSNFDVSADVDSEYKDPVLLLVASVPRVRHFVIAILIPGKHSDWNCFACNDLEIWKQIRNPTSTLSGCWCNVSGGSRRIEKSGLAPIQFDCRRWPLQRRNKREILGKILNLPRTLVISIRHLVPLTYFPRARGVQYVHWVMHKCIMVKVWGKNTRKVCKNLLNFLKIGGKFWKQGEIKNFRGSGGNVLKQAK